MTNEEFLKLWQSRMKEISRQMAQDNLVHFFSYGIVEKDGDNYDITASGALKGSGNDISMIISAAIQQDPNIGKVLEASVMLAKTTEEKTEETNLTNETK